VSRHRVPRPNRTVVGRNRLSCNRVIATLTGHHAGYSPGRHAHRYHLLGSIAPASGTSYARSACARPTSTTSPSQARRASWARSGSCNAAGNPPRTPRKAIAEGFRSDRVELFPLIPASVRSCATHASAEDRFLALPARSLGRPLSRPPRRCWPTPTSASPKSHTVSVSLRRRFIGTSPLREPRIPLKFETKFYPVRASIKPALVPMAQVDPLLPFAIRF
jgi:hypothetical protein